MGKQVLWCLRTREQFVSMWCSDYVDNLLGGPLEENAPAQKPDCPPPLVGQDTVGEVLGHTLASIGVSLGLSMNLEAVTARYVDVRLERKKEVLDAYPDAVKQAAPPKAQKAGSKK